MTVLLKPLGAAADYLNAIRIVDYLSDLEKVVLKFIADLKDNDLKQKVGRDIDLFDQSRRIEPVFFCLSVCCLFVYTWGVLSSIAC